MDVVRTFTVWTMESENDSAGSGGHSGHGLLPRQLKEVWNLERFHDHYYNYRYRHVLHLNPTVNAQFRTLYNLLLISLD